jgi:hypothetical protein
MPSVRFVPRGDVGSRPNIVVDGAPLPSTVLTLSHWPVNSTPERFKRDTSTETALAYVERHDPARVADIVTNNHFDEDGLFSMFAVTQPGMARRHAALLADAARAGDFGTCRAREAARLCFIIEAHADPKLSPLPPKVFRGGTDIRTASLYESLLPKMPEFLVDSGRWRRYWHVQDEHLDESESLIARGRAVVEEDLEFDLAIVRIPDDLPPRTVWRYLRREKAVLHPIAVHNATRCARVLRLQGRRIEFQYRYESWLQITSRRPALRVDLRPMCKWLNRRERNGTWTWEDTMDIAPRLQLTNKGESSISPEMFLRTLRHFLRTLSPAWDPFGWSPGGQLA